MPRLPASLSRTTDLVTIDTRLLRLGRMFLCPGFARNCAIVSLFSSKKNRPCTALLRVEGRRERWWQQRAGSRGLDWAT